VKTKYSGEHERSAEEHARSDLNRMPTLKHMISSLVEKIKEETKPK